MNNPTMLYKLGGVNKHYEPKIGSFNYDYIIVDDTEVQDYVNQGWGLTLTPLYLESIKPKELILPNDKETEQSNKSIKSKKLDLMSDNNL